METMMLEELIALNAEDLVIFGVTVTEEVIVDKRNYKERKFNIVSISGRSYEVIVQSKQVGDHLFDDTYFVKVNSDGYLQKEATFKLELD